MTSQSGGGAGYAGVLSLPPAGLQVGSAILVRGSDDASAMALRGFDPGYAADADLVEVGIWYLRYSDPPFYGKVSPYAIELGEVVAGFDVPSIGLNNGAVRAVSADLVGGLGRFGATAPLAASDLTGALSAVTDAAARNVLTSIVAALTADGGCTDGTT